MLSQQSHTQRELRLGGEQVLSTQFYYTHVYLVSVLRATHNYTTLNQRKPTYLLPLQCRYQVPNQRRDIRRTYLVDISITNKYEPFITPGYALLIWKLQQLASAYPTMNELQYYVFISIHYTCRDTFFGWGQGFEFMVRGNYRIQVVNTSNLKGFIEYAAWLLWSFIALFKFISSVPF